MTIFTGLLVITLTHENEDTVKLVFNPALIVLIHFGNSSGYRNAMNILISIIKLAYHHNLFKI